MLVAMIVFPHDVAALQGDAGANEEGNDVLPLGPAPRGGNTATMPWRMTKALEFESEEADGEHMQVVEANASIAAQRGRRLDARCSCHGSGWVNMFEP